MILTSSWSVSVIYPTVASYSAFERYSSLASRSASLSLQFGGVSIPVGTVLKTISTEAPVEENDLSTSLMTLQMWLIYWIVNSCVGVVESVLFLSSFPFYFFIRLCFSLWLLSPMFVVLNSGSSRLLETQLKSCWVQFFSRGCGLVFSRILKPFMDGKLEYLKLTGSDSILNGSQTRKSSISGFSAEADKTNWGELILQLASGTVNGPLFLISSVKRIVNGDGAQDALMIVPDLDDFDVIDSPSSKNADVTLETFPKKVTGQKSYPKLWFF